MKQKFSEIYKNSEIVFESNKLDEIKPWVNQGIKTLLKEKEIVFNRWKRNKNDMGLKEQYKKIRNKVTARVRKEYNKHYVQKFNNHAGDMKKIWSLSNEVLGKKKKKFYF